MKHTVTVKRTDGTADGWIVQCFAWKNQHDPNPQRIPLIFERKRAEKYTASFDLNPAYEYSLVSELRMGVAVEVTIDPKADIIQPPAGKWPQSYKVPATHTRDIFTVYFKVAG